MAKEIVEVNLDLTLFICMTALSCVWVLFLMFFNSRLLGVIVTKLINRFVCPESTLVKIGSFSVSVLGGKVMFHNLEYVDKDYLVKVLDGYISIRYHLTNYKTNLSHDQRTRRCRIAIKLNGVETYLYNRTAAYDHLREVKSKRNGGTGAQSNGTLGKSAVSSENLIGKDAEQPRPSTQQLGGTAAKEEPPPGRSYWQEMFPVVEVIVSKGTVVFSNDNLPSIWRITVQRAIIFYTTYDGECRSPLDLYKNTLDIHATNLCVRMLKNTEYNHTPEENADWDFWLLKKERQQDKEGKERDERKYIHEMQTLDAAEAKIEYTWDTAGITGTDEDQNAILPEQKVHIRFLGPQPPTLYFGPWANKHRLLVQQFFFPWDYEDRQVYVPTPGDPRPYAGVDLQIDFGTSTIVKLPFEQRFLFADQGVDSRTGAAVKMTFGAGSSLQMFLDWVPKDVGTVNTLVMDTKDVRIMTSQRPERFWDAKRLKFSLTQPNPLVWNAPREWVIDLDTEKVYLYFLRAHQPYLLQFMSEWAGKEATQTTFVPTSYRIHLHAKEYHSMICVNERNLMKKDFDTKDNAYLEIMAAEVNIDFCMDFTKLRVVSRTTKYNIMGTDLKVYLRLPASNTVQFIRQHQQRNHPYWTMLSLGVELTVVSPLLKDITMTSSMDVKIDGKGSRLEAHGFFMKAIHRFIQNYFGGYKWHGNEKMYQEMRKLMMGVKPDFSDMTVTKTDAPPNMVTVEVHNVDTYMDLDIVTCPIVLVPANMATPSHHYHKLGSIGVKESVQISEFSLHGHRMHGAPPFSENYASQYDFRIGTVAGQLAHTNLNTLMDVGKAFAFHWSDMENALDFEDQLYTDPDTCPLDLSVVSMAVHLQSVEFFLLGHGSIAQVKLPNGVQVCTSDLIRESAHSKMVVDVSAVLLRELMLVDELEDPVTGVPSVFGVQRKSSAGTETVASSLPEYREDDWLEVGYVVTSVSLVSNTAKPGWEADQEEQMKYLQYHDRASHRLPYIMRVNQCVLPKANHPVGRDVNAGEPKAQQGENTHIQRVGSNRSRTGTPSVQSLARTPVSEHRRHRVSMSALESSRRQTPVGELLGRRQISGTDAPKMSWNAMKKMNSRKSFNVGESGEDGLIEEVPDEDNASTDRESFFSATSSMNSLHSGDLYDESESGLERFRSASSLLSLTEEGTLGRSADSFITMEDTLAAEEQAERELWEMWLDDGTGTPATAAEYLQFLATYSLRRIANPHTYLQMKHDVPASDDLTVAQKQNSIGKDTIVSSANSLAALSTDHEVPPDPHKATDDRSCPVTTFVITLSNGMDVFLTPMALRLFDASDQSGFLRRLNIPQLLDALQMRYMSNLLRAGDRMHFKCARYVLACPALRLHMMQDCGSYGDDIAAAGFSESAPPTPPSKPVSQQNKTPTSQLTRAQSDPQIQVTLHDDTSTHQPVQADSSNTVRQSQRRMCLVALVVNDLSLLLRMVDKLQPVPRTNGLTVDSDNFAALYCKTTSAEVVGTVSCKVASLQIRTEKLGSHISVQGIPAHRQQVRYAHESQLCQFPTVLLDIVVDNIQGNINLETDKAGAAQVVVPRISIKCVELAVDVLAGMGMAWEPYVLRVKALAAAYRSQIALRSQALIRQLGLISKRRLARAKQQGRPGQSLSSIGDFDGWRRLACRLPWDWNWRLIMHLRSLWETLPPEGRKSVEAAIMDFSLKRNTLASAEFNSCVRDLEDWYIYQQTYNHQRFREDSADGPSAANDKGISKEPEYSNRGELLYFLNMVFDQATDPFTNVLPLQQRHKVEKPRFNIQTDSRSDDNWVELRHLSAQIDTHYQSRITRIIAGSGRPTSFGGADNKQSELSAKQTTTTILDFMVIVRLESLTTHLTDDFVHVIDRITEVADQNKRRKKYMKERQRERAQQARRRSQQSLGAMPGQSTVGSQQDGTGAKGRSTGEDIKGKAVEIAVPETQAVVDVSTETAPAHASDVRRTTSSKEKKKHKAKNISMDESKGLLHSASRRTARSVESKSTVNDTMKGASQLSTAPTAPVRWYEQLTPGGAKYLSDMANGGESERESKFYVNVSAVAGADTLALLVKFSDVLLRFECNGLDMASQVTAAPASERPQFALPQRNFTEAERNGSNDFLLLSLHEFVTTVSVDLLSQIGDKAFGSSTNEDPDSLTTVLRIYCSAPKFVRNVVKLEGSNELSRQCVLLHWDAFAVCLAQGISQIQVYIERFGQSGWLLDFFERRRKRQLTRFTFVPKKTATMASMTSVGPTTEQQLEPDSVAAESQSDTEPFMRGSLLAVPTVERRSSGQFNRISAYSKLKGNDRRRARIVRRKAAQELEARSKVPVVVTLDLCAVTLEANLMSSVHFAYKVDHVLCRVERLANGTLTDADFMLKHHRIEVQRMARNGPATPGRPSTSQSRFTDIRLPFPEIAVQATMRQGAIPASTPYAVTPHIVDAVVVVERVQVTLTTDVINQCLFVHYALLKAVDGLVTSVKSLDLIATPSTGDMGGGTGAAEGEAPKKIPVLYCVRGCVKTMSFTATSGNLAVTLSSQTATTYASNYRRAQQPPLTALELANSKGDDLFVDCALDAALTLHDLFATAPNSYWGRFSTGASARATRTMQNGVPTIAVAVLVNRTLLILRPRAVDRGLQVEFEQFQAAVARATMQVRQELDIQKIVDADSSIFKTVFTLEISNVCVAIPLGALSDTTRAPAEEWPLPALVFHIAQISACASNVNIAYGKLQSFNVQFTGTFDPNDMDTWAPKSDGKPVNVATMPYANFNWVIETSNPYRQTDPRVQNVRGKGKEPETARKASSMVVAVVFDIGGLVLDLHSTVGMYLSMIHHTFQEVTDTLTSSLDPKPIPVPVPTLNAPPSAPQQPPPDGRQSMQDLSVHVTLKISQGAITFRTPRNQPPQQQDTVIGPDVPVPEAEEVPKVSVEDTSIFIPSFGVRGNYQVTQTEKSMAGLEKAPESMTVHVQVGSFSNGITFKPFLLQFIDGAVDEYRAASVQFRSSTPVARVQLAEPASTPTAVDEEGMGVDNLGNLKVAVFLRMEKSEFSLNCMPKSLINCSIKLPAIDLVFSSIPGRYVTPVGAKKVHRGIRSVTVCLSQCFVRIHHPYSAAESFKIDLSEIRMQGSEQRTPADKNANSASRQSMFQGFGSGIGSESFMSSTSAISMEARKPPRRQLASILADVDQCTVFYNTRQLDELLQFVDMWFSRGYTRTVPQPQASTTALAIDAPAPLNAPSNPQPNVSPQKKPSLKSSSEALATPRYGRLASLGGGLDGSRGELKKKEGGGSGRMDVDLSAALENLGISADTIGLDGPENLLADLTREAKGTATVDAGPTSPKVGGRRESVGKSLRADVVDTDEGDYTARLVPKPATEIQSRRVVGCVRIKTVEIVANLGQAIGKIKLENHQLLAAGHYDTGAQENTTPPDPERFGTEMAGRAIVGDVHLSSFEKSGQALTGLLNGEITLKRLLVIGKGFRPASGIPDVGMGRTVAVTNNMALVALESMDANIKYHANPVLVIELERLQGSFYDQWTYTYGTAVPALDTRTCLLCKYFYILVSKETLPTFRTVAKKFGRLLEEQQGRLLAYSQAQPDAVGSYLQQRANRAAASAKKKAEAAVGRALHYLVNGSVMLAGEEVLLVCFWHSFFDQEWALFFLRHYRLNFQQAMDSAVAKRKCLVELGNGTDQSLAVMKMENKSNMRPGDWTASDWTKHVSSAPVSSYIIQVWRCSVSLKSQHHFASNTIQTWFVTQFPDSIGVSLDVSLYLFLKDTVLLYLSENQRRSKHKADQLPSAQKGEADKSGGGSTSVHSAEETKSQDKVSAHSGEQSRCSSKAKYTCMEFILKPELSLTSYSNMYPPDVEWVLEKLGFKNARHTIPKYMHQALLESLHKLIVQLAQMGSEPLQREMLPPPKPALDNTQSAGHLPGPQSGPNLVPRRQRSSMKTRPLSSAL